LNAFAERWVRSIRQECLSKLILFGEASLRRALSEFIDHHQIERNHQGKGNLLLFPAPDELQIPKRRTVHCRERLGGLLKYYSRAA
jgi:putative transposase